MKGLAILVFTGSANKGRCDWINETWGSNPNFILRFFTDYDGGMDLPEDFVPASVHGGYHSHLRKNAYAMEYAYHNLLPSCDWFLFIGDDNYVFTDNLRKFCEEKDPNISACYGQIENCWPQDKNLYYPLGGAGHLFSKAGLIDFIIKGPADLISFFNKEQYSDVAVGKILDDTGIKKVDSHGFFSQPPEKYNITEPQNNIVFHYINTKKQFLDLYQKENK